MPPRAAPRAAELAGPSGLAFGIATPSGPTSFVPAGGGASGGSFSGAAAAPPLPAPPARTKAPTSTAAVTAAVTRVVDHFRSARTRRNLVGEPFGKQAVPQAAVAHCERVAAEQIEHGRHDAGARQDHLGAAGLQARDRPALVGTARPVALDLPLDLVALEHAALDHRRVVF